MHEDAQLTLLEAQLAAQSTELQQLLQQLRALPPDLQVAIDASWLENFEELPNPPAADVERPTWAIRG